MASSSLSQEDYEHDFELNSRRTRIRTARAANARNAQQIRIIDLVTIDAEGDPQSTSNISTGFINNQLENEAPGLATCPADHDASPKPTSRSKDKRCQRINHVNKGKVQRERRKLREKRRSTGVVHLQSTESTGGSTGEDDESLISTETKKNTTFNETLDKDESPEVPSPVKCYPRLNKSPSDLDADDEDNQEYDSTLNQSDSTVSLVQEGDAEPCNANGQEQTEQTPCEEEICLEQQLLKKAQQEIEHLIEQAKEKDSKITTLEQKINHLSKEITHTDVQNKKLQEENRYLLNALSELKTD